MRPVLIIMLLMWMILPVGSGQAAPVLVGPDTDGLWLGRHLEILKDEPQGLTLEDLRSGAHDARFFSVPQDVPSLGYFNGNSYWARFTLQNSMDRPIELFLASRYATIDYITLYWPGPDGHYESLTLGDCVAYSKRSIQNRHPVFPITVPPGQHVYYVHMRTTTAVQFSLSLASPGKFLNYEMKESHYLGLLFGVCFVMFFYNLFVSIKFNSRAYAAYVSYIFLYIIFVSLYHGVLQQYVFPETENGWLFKNFIFISIDLISISCATFSIEFLDLKRSAPRFYRVLYAFRILLALNVLNWITLELGAKHMTLGTNFFFSVSLMVIGFTRSFSYRPARYYTLGWTIFLSSNLIMLLSNNGVINATHIGPWAQFTGAVLELVLLSLALGERVALINSERQASLIQQQRLQQQLIQSERDRASAQESLLREREVHIQSLDRTVFERTRDIQTILATINQGIFTIGLKKDSLHIGAEHSQYLTTMLATRDIQNQDPFQLIFARSDLASDIVDQTRQVLFSCIGDHDISFEVNSELLIREVILHKDDGSRLYVEIDWLPVLGPDERIDKILVILRDVTQLRILREQTRSQEIELLMTGELTSRQGRKFPQFFVRTRDQIDDIGGRAHTLPAVQTVAREERASILRFLHTLKGDARVYGFQTLAQCIHDAESSLLGLDAITSRDVAQVMSVVLHLLQRYDQIWRERLGFQQDAEERPAIPVELTARLFHFFEDVASHGPPDLQVSSRKLYKRWNEVLACGLDAVLVDQIRSLRGLAVELKKEPPQVVFQGEPCAIPQSLHTRLSQVFGHILANSMDHGIEDRDTRLRKGKSEQGRIYVAQSLSSGVLRIVYHDDGRGLNIGALRGRIANPEASLDEIAEAIFLPGLSTSTRASLISGRGIGMSAVRELLESMGGLIYIEVGAPQPEVIDFHAFTFVITLPLREQIQAHSESA